MYSAYRKFAEKVDGRYAHFSSRWRFHARGKITKAMVCASSFRALFRGPAALTEASFHVDAIERHAFEKHSEMKGAVGTSRKARKIKMAIAVWFLPRTLCVCFFFFFLFAPRTLDRARDSPLRGKRFCQRHPFPASTCNFPSRSLPIASSLLPFLILFHLRANTSPARQKV